MTALTNFTGIRSLGETEVAEIHRCFEEAFKNYYVPIEMTLEQFATRMKSEGVDYAESPGYFNDGVLQGFILYVFKTENGKRLARNAATGVVPAHRGKGLAKAMCDFSIQQFKQKGISEIVLEVMFANTYAIHVYEQCNFSGNRELIFLIQDATFKENMKLSRPQVLPGVEIRALVPSDNDWKIFTGFWSWQPSWQNSEIVVRELGTLLTILVAYTGTQAVGYVVVDSKTGRVPQMAVDKAWRRKGIGRQLINAAAELSEKPLGVVNMDAGDTSYYRFLQAFGFEEKMRQHEMRLVLS